MPIVKIKRGLKTNLPSLQLGELGFTIDSKELFVGTSQGNFKLSNYHYIGSSTPSDANDGDVWLDTSTTPNTFKVWNGSSWITPQVTIANNSVTTEKIADGAVTDIKISGRLSLSKLPTSSTANRVLAVTTANADPTYTQVSTAMIADGAVTDVKVSGRLSLSKLPTSSTANRALIVTTADSDPTYGQITEDFILLSDVTTNNATTARHGFCPKLSGNTQHFLRGDGTWAIPPSAGGGIVFSHWYILNPINTNTWYIPYAVNCTALTTLALTASRVYYIPFIPLVNCTLTNLAFEVTTASAGTASIGIYDTSNHRPNNLLGSVTGLDTGSTGVKSGSVSIALTAGQLYWASMIASAAATVRAIAVGGMSPILGIATGGTAWNTHYYQSGSGSTLPNLAGANTNGTGTVPVIYVRYTV